MTLSSAFEVRLAERITVTGELSSNRWRPERELGLGLVGRDVQPAAVCLRGLGGDVETEAQMLFITGYAENAVLNHDHLDPGMHVMTKPFVGETFGRRVRELISKSD